MKIRRTELLSLLAALVYGLAAAQTLWAAPSDCANAVTTADMRACADRDYRAADVELNRVYADLRSRLSGAQQERLKEAQRAWIAFRDRQAAFVGGVAAGGTLGPLLEVSELADLTRKRVEQLRRYLNDE